MSKRDAYLYYEAGQAVAAAHLDLTIRRISGNPAERASDILVPRENLKARLILWLTGMAAENRAVGKSDPLRRMRNRQRVRTYMEDLASGLEGSAAKRQATVRRLRAQAQDRANAIVSDLFPAIEQIAQLLAEKDLVSGAEIQVIVRACKSSRRDGTPGAL